MSKSFGCGMGSCKGMRNITTSIVVAVCLSLLLSSVASGAESADEFGDYVEFDKVQNNEQSC